MNKQILIILLTILFGQSEYQILNIPKSSFELATNNGLYSQNFIFEEPDYSYKASMILYPSDIGLYNIQYNNISFSILDYGQFENNLNNNSLNTFYANEVLLKYSLNKEINKLGVFALSTSGYYSQIDTYKSYGLVFDIGYKKEFKNMSASLSIENIGYIIKTYTNFDLKLPLRYRLGVLYKFEHINFGYDAIYFNNQHNYQHIINLNLLVSNNVTLHFSNSNYNQSMHIESYDYNFLSGMAMGTSINLKYLNLDFSLMNLGSAGLVYAITLQYWKI